jgi:hypothetical protein
MRTAYLSHGPCLTDVVYAGVTADGKIAARVEVMLPRTDDCVRVYHRFRYDVRQPVRFSRLAFYQVGADHYNDPRFDRLARGSADGLTEEWSFTKGGKRYDRAGVPLSGSEPWISLHAGTDPDPKGGGYATRGLVVRSWKARLGGKEVPTPYAAFFGTEDGNVPGMNAELAPPPGVTQLQPGDFVEAEVELLVIPMSADEYYGPNENLRAALRAGANSWQPIHRGARCGGLAVTALRGRLLSRTPVAVRASSEGACLAIQGGLGYVPVTFRGLHDYRGWQLVVTAGGRKTIVDQSVHGRDFWQAYYDAASKTWSLTYNVPLDTTADARRTVHLDLRRAR